MASDQGGPATPLDPRIPADRTLPWKLVPARVFLHAGTFAGVLLELLDFGGRGGPLDGMSYWVYAVWVAAGLTAGPTITIAYVVLHYDTRGKSRYLALRIQSVANLLALWVLGQYAYSQWAENPALLRSQSLLAWCVVAAMIAFFAFVVCNDLSRMAVLERRAEALEAEEQGTAGA